MLNQDIKFLLKTTYQAKMIKKKIAILISGNGSNMIELLKDMRNEDHPGIPILVIADNYNADGIKKAKKFGCIAKVIDFQSFSSKFNFENKLIYLLKKNQIELICLAGFMKVLSKKFVDVYKNRILNIHPSLLPLYQGLETHQRVLTQGLPFHGATVHVVTEKIDKGKIIAQGITYVSKKDDETKLSKRVLKIEHKIYKYALRHYLEKKDEPILYIDKKIKKFNQLIQY